MCLLSNISISVPVNQTFTHVADLFLSDVIQESYQQDGQQNEQNLHDSVTLISKSESHSK